MSEETTEPRQLSELLLLDYSDMTEEEINIVIEWRAQIKARDSIYQERLEQDAAMYAVLLAKLDEKASEARAAHDELALQAAARLDAALEASTARWRAIEGGSDGQNS